MTSSGFYRNSLSNHHQRQPVIIVTVNGWMFMMHWASLLSAIMVTTPWWHHQRQPAVMVTANGWVFMMHWDLYIFYHILTHFRVTNAVGQLFVITNSRLLTELFEANSNCLSYYRRRGREGETGRTEWQGRRREWQGGRRAETWMYNCIPLWFWKCRHSLL